MKRNAHAIERARRVWLGLVCLCIAACSTSPQATRPSGATPPAAAVQPHSAAGAVNFEPAQAEAAQPVAQPAAEKPVASSLDAAPAKPSEPKTANRGAAKPAAENSPAQVKSVVTQTTKPKTAPVVPASRTKLLGHIDIVAAANQSTAANDVTDTVVYYIPDAGAVHPKPGRFQIYTRDKQFDPPTLVVPLGSTVSFPNKDQILHNVFSVSPGAAFDLGLYGEGGTAEYTFKSPGLVLINCNVHQGMQANLLVLDTPYYTHADKDGRFELDVPTGTGKVIVWNPRAGTQALTVAAPTAAPLSMRVTLTKPRLIQHLNKERKAY